MADTKITDLAQLANGALVGTDMFPVVDVSDSTMAGSGTTKRFAASGIVKAADFNGKGELLAASANDTPAVLTAGTDGDILTANSGETTGLEWITPDTVADLTPLGPAAGSDLVAIERSGAPGSLSADEVASMGAQLIGPNGSQAGATSVTVNATAASLRSVAMTDAIPANTLAVGDVIVTEAWGVITNDSGGAHVYTFRTYLDNTIMAALAGPSVADPGAATPTMFRYRSVLRVNTLGTSGAAGAAYLAQVNMPATAVSTGPAVIHEAANVVITGFDTTTALTPDFRVLSNAATATQTADCYAVTWTRFRQ